MKKFRFFSLMIAALGLGFGFTSCDEDVLLDEDGGAQTIMITNVSAPSEVAPGDSMSVSYKVGLTTNKLDKIEIRSEGTAISDLTVEEFEDNTLYNGAFDYVAPEEEGDYSLVIYVVDNKGNEQSEPVDFTVKKVATPLGEVESVILTYKSANQTDGENISEVLGLEYSGNVDDGNTAKFEVYATDNSFVMLGQDEAEAIETVEELSAAYEDGEKVESFQAKSDANFEDQWLVTLVDDVYYWVHMTDLTFDPGNNQAYFDYKK